jgi:hypothetical protein
MGARSASAESSSLAYVGLPDGETQDGTARYGPQRNGRRMGRVPHVRADQRLRAGRREAPGRLSSEATAGWCLSRSSKPVRLRKGSGGFDSFRLR